MKGDLRRYQGRCGQNHKDFIATGDGLALARARTEALDELLLAAWRRRNPSGCIIALDEYGRSEIYPHSPVSLLLLDAPVDCPADLLGEMENGGLHLEIATDPAAVDLFDARFLAGDARLFENLPRESPAAMLPRLVQESNARHQEFEQTVYLAEPDVLRSPGGLLDFQLIDVLSRLLETDIATSRQRMRSAHRFLAAERAHLHLLGREDANVLTLARQEQVAKRAAKTGGPATPEDWMRLHYQHARHVHRLARHMLLQAGVDAARPRTASADFSIQRGEVFLRHPSSVTRDPGLWLDLFAFAARYGVPLGIETERHLEREIDHLASWSRHAGDLWPRFRQILTEARAYSALAAMRDAGALGVLLPEFRKIESLLLRDGYHRYTEDEHTLLAIRYLRELGPESRFGPLLDEIERMEPLLLALFLSHLDGEIPARFDIPEPDLQLARFLIEHQSLMASIAGSRHVADPAAVQDFAARAGTVERLRMLCLFTHATLKAVGPAALTGWKEEALWRLMVAAQEELTRRLDTDRTTPAETQGVFRPEVAAFLEGFPRRYLKTHTPAEILSHFHLAQDLARRPVQLSLTHRRSHYRLLVLTTDHPFLFAAITGTLASFGMNILKAEAFSNRRGLILDTFEFVDLKRSLDGNAEHRRHLLESLEAGISGRVDVSLPVPIERRSVEAIPSEIHFDNSASAASTLLEVTTHDRPGLLFRISSVLSAHGCNIEVVLVDTQGRKAKDVFYITRYGAPLDPEWQAALRQELLRVLNG